MLFENGAQCIYEMYPPTPACADISNFHNTKNLVKCVYPGQGRFRPKVDMLALILLVEATCTMHDLVAVKVSVRNKSIYIL